MGAIKDYAIAPTQAEQVSATSLSREVGRYENVVWECYRISSPDTAEIGWMIYAPEWNRAGVAWGGDAQWTDCASPQDAMERYLGLNGKEMCN